MGPNAVGLVSVEEEMRTQTRVQARPCEGTGRRQAAVCQPRAGASEGASPAGSPLILDFQPPQRSENRCLLFKPRGLWGTDVAA